MVILRLARGGAKKRPFYHIVATDKRNRRDGRNLERLGYFNPVAQGQEKRLHINMERIEFWIGNGAQTSNRVAALIKEAKNGPLTEEQIQARKAKKEAKKAAKAKAEEPQQSSETAEAPAEAAAE